jgi:putative DNA primase/helicase
VICICADDDWKTVVDGTPTNVGQLAAIAAARAVDGKVAIPLFSGQREDKWTDFNDLSGAAGEDGLAEVRRQIEAVLGNTPPASAANTGSNLWLLKLIRGNDGAPRDCLANVALALRGDSAFVHRLRFDEHRGMAVCRDMPWDKGGTWREWAEGDDLALMEWLALKTTPGLIVKKTTVADAVAHVAHEHKYHPVREWLRWPCMGWCPQVAHVDDRLSRCQRYALCESRFRSMANLRRCARNAAGVQGRSCADFRGLPGTG